MDSEERMKLSEQITRTYNLLTKQQHKLCNKEITNFDNLKTNTKYQIDALKNLYSSKFAEKLGKCDPSKKYTNLLDKLLKIHLEILEYDCKKIKKQCDKFKRFKEEYSKNPKDYGKLYSLFLQFAFIYDP
jgi:hypothetical protein